MVEATRMNLSRGYKVYESLACAGFICTVAVLPLLTFQYLVPYLIALAASGGVPAVFLVYYRYLVDRQSLSFKGYLGVGTLTVLLASFVSTIVALTYDALTGDLEPSSIGEFTLTLLVGLIGYSAFGLVFCFVPGLVAAYAFGSKIRPLLRQYTRSG